MLKARRLLQLVLVLLLLLLYRSETFDRKEVEKDFTTKKLSFMTKQMSKKCFNLLTVAPMWKRFVGIRSLFFFVFVFSIFHYRGDRKYMLHKTSGLLVAESTVLSTVSDHTDNLTIDFLDSKSPEKCKNVCQPWLNHFGIKIWFN